MASRTSKGAKWLWVAGLLLLSLPLAASSSVVESSRRDINDQTVRLYQEGRLQEAITSAIKATTIARERETPDLLDATIFENNAELFRITRRYDEAERLFQASESAYQRLDAVKSGRYATMLNNYGLLKKDIGNLDQALTLLNHSYDVRLAFDPNNMIERAATLCNIADAHLDKRQFDRSLQYYWAATRLTNARSQTLIYAYSQIAMIERGLSRLLPAVSAYERLIPLMRRSDPIDKNGLGRALVEFANLRKFQGLPTESERLYDEAEALLRSESIPHERGYVDVLSGQAALYSEVGRFDEATSKFDEYILILSTEFPDDKLARANALGALAEHEARRRNFSAAEAAYKASLLLIQQAKLTEHADSLSIASNFGYFLLDRGNISDATPILTSALALAVKNNFQSDYRYPYLLNNVGHLYMLRGSYEDARNIFTRALEVTERVFGGPSIQYANILINLADTQNRAQRWNDAERSARRAIAIISDLPGNNSFSLTFSYYQLGTALADDLPGAIMAFEEAKRFGLDAGPTARTILVSTLRDLLAAYEYAGRFEDAARLLEDSVSKGIEVFGATAPGAASGYSYQGFSLAGQGKYQEALVAFETANSFKIRELRREWSVSVSDFSTRNRLYWQGFYGQIQAASRTAATSPAERRRLADSTFQVAQWADITESSHSISQSFARGNQFLEDRVRRRQDLAINVARHYRQLVALQDRPNLGEAEQIETETLLEKITDLQHEQEQLNEELRKGAGELIGLASPEALSISDVQTYLKNNEALIYILPTPRTVMKEETFIWVVTKDAVHLNASPAGMTAMRKFVETLRCGLDRELWSPDPSRCAKLVDYVPDEEEPLPFRVDYAFALYYQLFGPIEEDIKGKDLIIVNNGVLATLPFEVLPTKLFKDPLPESPEEYRSVPWLIKSHAVTTLPSVSSLRLLRARKASVSDRLPFGGFGDPSLKGSGCRSRSRSLPLEQVKKDGSSRVEISQSVERLCPLPESRAELDSMAEALGSNATSVVVRDQFTEEKLRSMSTEGLLSRYRVLQFSTHGLLPFETDHFSDSEPALVATPSGEDDGLLTSSEISKLKLSAEWVILAACNTGSGAGGLHGLAEAFFYAGARAVLISNWETNSDATVQLGIGLANKLREGSFISLSIAHQASVLSVINNIANPIYSHPEYWAPYSVVGIN
ncbi:CHAT domain-containing tetratricopeptide repeat protein [Rhizobium leguminosarum]|nr:CHAT domain-containing protein [Rhizobium leguminosarum]